MEATVESTHGDERDWLHRHAAAGAVLVGVVFGLLFGAVIAAIDTHGWRFAFTVGPAIGLLVFAPYVWWKLR
jgi:MFS family permease